MRILFLFSLMIVGVCFAADAKHYCNDPETNRQWQDALTRYPNDPLVLRLATKRDTLCELLREGAISVGKAQSLWEQALTEGLLERARAEERKRGLLPLFSTF